MHRVIWKNMPPLFKLSYTYVKSVHLSASNRDRLYSVATIVFVLYSPPKWRDCDGQIGSDRFRDVGHCFESWFVYPMQRDRKILADVRQTSIEYGASVQSEGASMTRKIGKKNSFLVVIKATRRTEQHNGTRKKKIKKKRNIHIHN